MSVIDEMRTRAIEAHVRRLAKTLSKERANELLYGTKWPDPLKTTHTVQWEESMNDDYVERARNATIEECASHLIAVQMDNAEAYAEELRTMKRGDVPQPWWLNDHAPKITPDVVLPWKVWYKLAEEMANKIVLTSDKQDELQLHEKIARSQTLFYHGTTFRPATRPEGYEVPEP